MIDPSVKRLWIIVGTISLVLGALGIIFPFLPTTPLLLLSAFCYAKSSQKLYDWLLGNKLFGRHIKNWREGRGIPLKAKTLAVTMIAVSIGYSVIYIVPYLIAKVLLVLIAVIVSCYIITRPTTRR
jgi:uncharacterized membrane protein YbaN (DUF454 family)